MRSVPFAALWIAARAAVEAIGWLTLLTVILGGLHATHTDWITFFSGALWIGLPLIAATAIFLRHLAKAQEPSA